MLLLVLLLLFLLLLLLLPVDWGSLNHCALLLVDWGFLSQTVRSCLLTEAFQSTCTLLPVDWGSLSQTVRSCLLTGSLSQPVRCCLLTEDLSAKLCALACWLRFSQSNCAPCRKNRGSQQQMLGLKSWIIKWFISQSINEDINWLMN